MGYVLESESEFDRLERQSQLPQYDLRKELRELKIRPRDRILDAGCGSGVVSRALGLEHPETEVVACDSSEERLRQARERAAADGARNISFVQGDLTTSVFPDQSFDVVVCRYVLQHIRSDCRTLVLRRFHDLLRPGGRLIVIDFDGLFHNLFPQTPQVRDVLRLVEEDGGVDLRVGRKIPAMLVEAGFGEVRYRIDTFALQGSDRQSETAMIQERLRGARGYLAKLLGSESRADEFAAEYLRLLEVPGSVYFHDKFIVQVEKEPALRVVSG